MTADSLLHHCMSNHQFGLAALLASRDAARKTRDALKDAVRRAQPLPATPAEPAESAEPAAEAAEEEGAGAGAAVEEKGRPQWLQQAGAWEALPVLVQRTYLLSQADYAQVGRHALHVRVPSRRRVVPPTYAHMHRCGDATGGPSLLPAGLSQTRAPGHAAGLAGGRACGGSSASAACAAGC